MTEYSESVQRQAKLLAAEEWAKGVSGIHAHSLNSMWYDTRPQDTDDGKSVIDITYNSGLIKRRLNDDTEVYFGKELKGDDLIYEYEKTNA
jgi:hypothetical protein